MSLPKINSAPEAAVSHARTVLFLDHTAKLGGGEIALFHLVTRLDRSRYLPVVVLCSDGPLRERLEEEGIETHVIPLDARIIDTRKGSLGKRALLHPKVILRSFGYCRLLARFFRERNAALVHTNSLKSDFIGGVAARMARLPVVWHVRDRIAEDYLPAPAVRLFRLFCRFLPTSVIANSHATMTTLHLPTGNGAGRGGRVIHDGVLEAAPKRGGRLSGTAAPLVGIVGRLTAWKGQHLFLDAAAQVHRQFPAAQFEIVGSPMFGEEAYEQQLREQARRLGIAEYVHFAGFRRDVEERMRAMDVLVHASTTGEPFGQVVAEGMMVGTPVIATNGGGVPEIVEDGVSGLLVPMGDSDALADAILALLRDPQKARRLGAAGRCRVLEHFPIERTVAGVQSLFDEILAPKRK
jgi:glycosyltransferase involved in cell wall biosynthesis